MLEASVFLPIAAVAAASTLQASASAASNLHQEDDYFNKNSNNNSQQQQQQSINASIGQDGSSVVALLAARLPSHPELVTQLTLLVIINLIVVAGNILVILAVCASAKLKSVTNTFVVSLAIADLLLGFLVLPYAVLFEVLDAWVFGELWCRGWLSMDVWISTASILNLCAISIDRYVAVTRPVKYRSLMTARRAKSIVAGVWLVAFVICLPPLIPQWGFSGGSSSLGAAALGNSALNQANASLSAATSMPLNENSTPTLVRYSKTSASTVDNNDDDDDKDALAGDLAASKVPAHGNSNRRSSRRPRRVRQNVAWYLCCCDIGAIGGGGESHGAKTPLHANCALQAPHVPPLPAAELSILASNATRDKANVAAAAMKCYQRRRGARLAPSLSVRSIADTRPESNHHNCRLLGSKFKSNVLVDAGSAEAVVVDQRSRCVAQRCARGHLDKRRSSSFGPVQLERQDQVSLSGRQSHDHSLDPRARHHRPQHRPQHHQQHHQQHKLQRWSLTKSKAIVARSLAANEIGNNDHRNRRAAVKPPALEVASVTAGGFNSLEASEDSKAATPTVAPTTTTTTSAITTNNQRQRGCALFDGKLYVVYSALGSFYIPMLVMVFVYSRIYLVAARAQRALKRGYVTAKAPQQHKHIHSTHGRHSKAATAAGAENGGTSTSANAIDANASPFDAGGERVTLRIHRRERSAVNSTSGAGGTSATGTTAGTCSGEQQASYGQLSALERLGAAEQRRRAAAVAIEPAIVAATSNPPQVIQVQALPPTSPEPKTQQALEPQTQQSKLPEPVQVVVTHPSRRQNKRKRASSRQRAARQAPRAAGSAITAAVSVAAGSMSSVRITLSPCADFDYDHCGNHQAYEICHQAPLPPPPVAIEVTPPGTESDVALLAAPVKERSLSVHAEPNQPLKVDLLNGQQRVDRSNSFTLNAAAGWQEKPRMGCSADLRAAASDGALTTSEVGGTQNAGCLRTEPVRPHRAASTTGSSSSLIHGLLGELRAPANQVRKQSILLISTITSRSSQTLRHLSLAASQPVGSLFKHRSRHRRPGSSSPSTPASSADESCDDDEDGGGHVGKNTTSSKRVRKQRRRRGKRTLDDYLMGVAGIDSTTTDSSSSYSDESVNDDGDDEETPTTLFVQPLQMPEKPKQSQVQVSGPGKSGEVTVTSNPITQLKTNAIKENAAVAQYSQTIGTQIADTKKTAATKEELNNKQQATTQSAQKSTNLLKTTSASRQSLSKRGMRRFNKWHAKRLHERRFAAEYRIAAMIGVIVGGFCLCWLPFFTAYLWRAVVCERPDCVPKSLLSLFIWLGYFNSAVNPVLYGLFSPDFRAAFKNIVCRCRLRGATDNSTVAQLVDNILKSIL